ncbi:histone deacetylase HosB [Paracoccidioides lutzii Pb01]|uniref:Histone deacetylase HosB n=1 Tax=Paracoccidioides lutzii (strain ATCC MYA-826 / Pb01) TaxID=502779 RepID=C1HCW4_PARBA|nr:histone deacetylase HosB [Paracoccidioides lutzii Pb01]EEH39336.1 histone deacetylase HosB [Paracoccidioides lutzii Pb01]
MDRSHRDHPGSPSPAARLQGRLSTKHADKLASSFTRLPIATGSVIVGPSSSPSPSPYQSPSRFVDRNTPFSRHNSPSRALANHPSVPRRNPSTSSLREERRGSTPSLQKRSSVSSLRSVQNYSRNGVTPQRPSLSRPASSNFLSTTSSSMRPKSPLAGPDSPIQPLLPTASSIANSHFKKELALHQSADLHSKTLVIVQDACYGHRFSRPRTSKASLEQIVERPERLLASVLGVSTAYIRMGRRYDDGQFAPHPDLDLRSLPIPPFQVRKTTRTMPINSPAVTHVHGIKWMDELRVMCYAAESRLALNGKELVRPSSSGKDNNSSSSLPKLHEGDLYLCSESLNAFEGALGGVCEAVDVVFGPTSTTRAFVSIRPPGHHCSADYPSGFCWLNNVHVGITHAAMSHGLTHAAIIDFDLHHGDGSQEITWEQNRKAKTASKNAPLHKKMTIGYYSLHDINSYPCENGDLNKVRNASLCIDNAHGQSIWNVHLEPWKSSASFWELYNKKYTILLEKARKFLRSHTLRLLNSQNPAPPKAAIFISAGFDASEWEGVGMQRHKVNVPTDFYAKFTSDIVRMSEEEGLGVDGRVISVLEGGYSDRALISGVLSHLSGLADSQTSIYENGDNRLAAEMLGRLGLNDVPEAVSEESSSFDTEWWKLPLLEEIERLANPLPPAPTRKSHEKSPPTYCSPTQASAAKIVIPSRDRRSISSQLSAGDGGYMRPPLPAIDWATAAYEMSKILIPTDRQTVSFQHAELKAEGARTRPDRHSTSNISELQPVDDRRSMQLRERKLKSPSPELQIAGRSSQTSRRTTIASISDLPETSTVTSSASSNQNLNHVYSRNSRRLSVASTVASTIGGNPSKASVEGTSPTSSNGDCDRTLNSRPGTSNGKPADLVTVKKSRVTGVRSSPRKAAPPPQARAIGGSPIPPFDSSSINTDTAERELTKLSVGIKKLSIKLKVPSPEEHAAREEERLKVSANKFTSRKTRKTQAPKKSGSRSTKSSAKTLRPGTALGEASAPPVVLSAASGPVKQEAGSPTALANPDIEMIHTPDLTTTPFSAKLNNGAAISGWPSESGMQQTQQKPSKRLSPDGTFTPHISHSLTPRSLGNSQQPQITVKPPPTSRGYKPATQQQQQQQQQQTTNIQLPVFTSTSAIPFATSSAVSSAAPPGPRQENRREQ